MNPECGGNALLEPAEQRFEIEPAGQQIQERLRSLRPRSARATRTARKPWARQRSRPLRLVRSPADKMRHKVTGESSCLVRL